MSIEEILQRITPFESKDFSGRVAPAIIDEAEQALRLPCSPEYRTFLE